MKKVTIKSLVSGAFDDGSMIKKGQVCDIAEDQAMKMVKEGKAEIVSVGTGGETRESKTVKAKRG